MRNQFSSIVQTQIHGEEICEKLTLPQLVMKFPAVYDTEQFITISATAHHFSFPCATYIQSSHYNNSVRTLILFPHYIKIFQVVQFLQLLTMQLSAASECFPIDPKIFLSAKFSNIETQLLQILTHSLP